MNHSNALLQAESMILQTPDICPLDGPSVSAEALLLANRISSGASILGCLFNIILTCALRNYKEPLIKMVLMICFADIIFATTNILLGGVTTTNLLWICDVVGIFRVSSYIASLTWTCFFARALYVCVVHENARILAEKFQKYFIYSIPIPVFYGIYASQATCFSPNWVYCMQKESRGASSTELTLTFFPAIIVIIYTTYCYGVVMKKLRMTGHSTPFELLIYPAVLLLCLVPAEAVTVYKWVYYECANSLGIFSFAVATMNLQGLLNAFVYGFSHINFKKCKKRRNDTALLKHDESDIGMSGSFSQTILRKATKPIPTLYEF